MQMCLHSAYREGSQQMSVIWNVWVCLRFLLEHLCYLCHVMKQCWQEQLCHSYRPYGSRQCPSYCRGHCFLVSEGQVSFIYRIFSCLGGIPAHGIVAFVIVPNLFVFGVRRHLNCGQRPDNFLLINYSFIVEVENHNHPLDVSLCKAHYLVWNINSVLELMVRSRHHNI